LIGDHGAADASSPLLTNPLSDQEIQSSASVEPSSGVVAADLAALNASSAGTCLAKSLSGITLTTSSGVPVTISSAQASPTRVAIPGASGTWGLTLAVSMTGQGRVVPMTMELLGFGVGRDGLSLMTVGVARPFPEPDELYLSELLVSRALAQPH
jgi:hypothetical protein